MAGLVFTDVSFTISGSSKTKKGGGDPDDNTIDTGSVASSAASYVAKTSKKKHILRNVSGHVNSGGVLGILGPSGAGKTTLLNVLTLTAFGGIAEGLVTLGGEPMNYNLFQKRCVCVEQFSRNWEFLTPRETVRFAADLYLPDLKKIERREKVETMLEKMGLQICADTKCGGTLFQGLSGGQQKRLSLAVALIKRPSLIFLDEPTSGLDAASATAIMEFVKNLAEVENLIIVVTIHQPSQKVYKLLSSVMLLSGGRVGYFGTSNGAVDFFSSIGRELPADLSIAEYMLDLANAEFSSTEDVNALLDAWDERRSNLTAAVDAVAPPKAAKVAKVMKYAGWKQYKTLTKRHLKLLVRDPLLYTGRALTFFGVCTFFSVVYVATRNREQTQVLNKLFLNMWVIGVPACLGTVSVFSYTQEFASITSEVRNGMVSPTSYYLANATIQVPAMFFLGFCALLPQYLFVDWTWSNIGLMLVVYSTTLLAFEAIAQLIAAVIENALLGMMFYMNIWFTCFLFAGILVPVEDIIWPLRAFCYSFPLRWCFRSMAYLEFDENFSGAEFCDNAGEPGCFFHYESSTSPMLPGWSCVNDESSRTDAEFVCFGKTGAQVIDTLGVSYSTLSSENTVAVDFLINAAIYFGAKLCLLVALHYRTKKHANISEVISL